jgi:malate dehydrogenase (oxaloacetate-decarboxylating)
LQDADVFIGVSAPGCLKSEWICKMKPDPIIFALANPNPEILPEEAKKAGAFIYASGRPDMKNQLDNALVYPGLLRGLLEIRAKKVTTLMKLAAARAISSLVTNDELRPEKIIPDVFDVNIPLAVARIIILMGRKDGVGAKPMDLEESGSELYYHTIHGRYLERRFWKNQQLDEKEFSSKAMNP